MEGNSIVCLEEQPAGERWDPLGASNDDEIFDFDKLNFCDEDHQ